MAKQIYVNLPVKDLPKTRAFFAALGFSFDSNFSNDDAACMIIGENIYAMLLVEKFFASFISKSICNTTQSTEVLICISADSRAEVDQLVAKARAAGGAVTRQPQDHGFMYAHGFEDLDGHIWEVCAMATDGNVA